MRVVQLIRYTNNYTHIHIDIQTRETDNTRTTTTQQTTANATTTTTTEQRQQQHTIDNMNPLQNIAFKGSQSCVDHAVAAVVDDDDNDDDSGDGEDMQSR